MIGRVFSLGLPSLVSKTIFSPQRLMYSFFPAIEGGQSSACFSDYMLHYDEYSSYVARRVYRLIEVSQRTNVNVY